MKIIHHIGWYFPDSCGGSEVYVDGLANNLNALGTENIIAAPRIGTKEDSYTYHGVKIYRYPVPVKLDLEQIRHNKVLEGFEIFSSWLKSQNASIYHQHSWNPGCGIHHLRHAKKLGMKTIITIHMPNFICLRGTMMLFGDKACDGKIDLQRCAACWGHSVGIPGFLSKLFSCLPLSASRWLKDKIPPSCLNSILGRKQLTFEHCHRFKDAVLLADRIIVVCEWLRRAFMINEAPMDKVILCRHGIEGGNLEVAEIAKDIKTLNIAYFGRWVKVKGIHTLVRAVKMLPKHIKVKLTIYGSLAVEESELEYRKKVVNYVKGDDRIREEKELPNGIVTPEMSKYDLIAVPSEWMETGPLTVLEAFAAGVPVIGSDLGGISELVQHGINGWLVPPRDVHAWANAIAELSINKTKFEQLRKGISPPLSAKSMAEKILHVYQNI